ncbi:MAG: DUF3343 domain-containing protein [Pyramidobacter sp.]
MKCLATFDVTSMALMFEKYCRKEGLSVRIVPVPRQISASCGLACSYPCDQVERIERICAEKKIEISGKYTLEG